MQGVAIMHASSLAAAVGDVLARYFAAMLADNGTNHSYWNAHDGCSIAAHTFEYCRARKCGFNPAMPVAVRIEVLDDDEPFEYSDQEFRVADGEKVGAFQCNWPLVGRVTFTQK